MKFIKHPTDASPLLEQTAQFVCVVNKAPEWKITWQKSSNSKNGTWSNIVTSSGAKAKYQHLKSNSLKIHRVQESDAGKYRCVADNGDHSKAATLMVKGKKEKLDGSF